MHSLTVANAASLVRTRMASIVQLASLYPHVLKVPNSRVLGSDAASDAPPAWPMHDCRFQIVVVRRGIVTNP